MHAVRVQGTPNGQSEWFRSGVSNIRSVSVSLKACALYPFLVVSCNCQGPYARQVQFGGPGFTRLVSDGAGFYFHSADMEN